MTQTSIIIATRGSALALAQANMVLAECRKKFPKLAFALKIIKSTGDRLQAIPMSRIDANLPRGLFTKELEVALLKGRADMAVHSLKDLPTQLPDGLILGAVAGKRADVRDVLIYRDVFKPKTKLADFPPGLVLATSSTRRKAQILARRPDFKVVEIRGNVHTMLDTTEMLPCAGQGALGLEIREKDERMADICRRLNHDETFQCVTAERALLSALGGGCQTPVGACATIEGGKICLRAVSFLTDKPRRAAGRAPLGEAPALGKRVAARLI
jgi:porphobilinogen deaminase